MKRLLLFLFVGMFLSPVSSHAADDHLDFTFKWHCEKEETNCESEIPEKDDQLMLTSTKLSKSFLLDIVIHNPDKEQINSARVKLKYDPEALLVEEILSKTGTYSDFSLEEPNAQVIDDQEGTITIGMAGLSSNAKEIQFASLKMTLLKETATVEYLNVQQSELGDTGIYQREGGLSVINILPGTPLPLVLARTGNMFSPGDDDDDLIDSPRSTDLPKPEGLVLQTNENGSVTLFWPTDDEYPIAGYYLYYGKDPSLLIRRKDVSSRNFVEFPAGTLDRGEKYYFQVSAYDLDNLESEASDIVWAIVGQPGTESNPFEGDPRKRGEEETTQHLDTEENTTKETISPPNKTTDSGPEHILFFLVVSVGIAFFGYSFRKIRF